MIRTSVYTRSSAQFAILSPGEKCQSKKGMAEILSFRFDEVFGLIAFASTSGELTDRLAVLW